MSIKASKPTSAPEHRAHEAYVHNVAPRLEGEVKNRGIKPRRKPKKGARRVASR